jgi:hypothetical protein
MTEKDLKDQLVKHLRLRIPRAVVLRHEDKNTAGIPDITVTYMGHTVWLEVKFANPYIVSRGLQNFTCRRLAAQGVCWYIIYKEHKEYRNTILARPEDVVENSIVKTPDECVAAGFDHEFVVKFIRRLCGDHNEQKHLSRNTRHASVEEGAPRGSGEA